MLFCCASIPADLPVASVGGGDMADDARLAKSMYGNIVYYDDLSRRLNLIQESMIKARNVMG